MIQIIYGTGSYFTIDLHGLRHGVADHEERAKALASVTPGAHCGPVQISGIEKPGLDTLCYWGHGDATHFCDLTPEDFVKNVSAWKKVNPQLKVVEILTCNARHNRDGLSYTARLKPLLQRRHADIVLKGMPMGMGSFGPHNWSILKAHTPTKTWFYVTAGGQKDTDEMWPAVHLVEKEAKLCGNDLAAAGARVQRKHPTRKFGLMFGTFAELRSNLTPIA